MTEELSVEATGETLGEAKWSAIRELERLIPGLDRESVRFQVVTEGERGLLGVGTTPAQVVATAPAPTRAASPEGDASRSSEGAIASGLLERVATALGTPLTIELDEGDREVRATVTGGDAGVLIGRHGQMLDALQLLANAVAHHAVGGDRRRIVIDAAGYRSRREATLEQLARRTAERVAATGERAPLEPMSAVERRIVHEALKDDPEVATVSDGDEPYRYVVIVPRHGSR
jgi:spoIIIJ-associated protein